MWTVPWKGRLRILPGLLLLLCCWRSNADARELTESHPITHAFAAEAVVAGMKFGTKLTLTTSMLPQRAHPMGDPRGGGGGGFINQHMKLLTMLTLAIYLKVDTVILPPATSRDTFEVFAPKWQTETAASLWDVDSIIALCQKYNITVVLGKEDDAPPGALVLPTYFCRVLEIEFLASEIYRFTHLFIAKLPQQPTSATPILIYAPDLILALRTDNLPLYAEVAKQVKFAPKLAAIADEITSTLMQGTSEFNGLHLRVEGDMREIHNVTIAAGLTSYHTCIKTLNYSKTPLYIASGIFVEGGRVDTERYGEVDVWLKQSVMAEGHASSIANRRLLVRQISTPISVVARLHSEQRAAIDFLVLLRASKIVGSRLSSFSFMLREFRALAGYSRETSGIVGDVWGLFKVAAAFDI